MSKNCSIIDVEDKNFEKEVIESTEPVLVDLLAERSTQYRPISPIIEGIAREFSDRVRYCRINIDQDPSIPMRYLILRFPTLLLYRRKWRMRK